MSFNHSLLSKVNIVRDSLSILVVDDMKFSCEYIRRALKKEGYSKIDVINSASEALIYLQEKPVDIVIADWVMPEMNGLDLTRLIRQLDIETRHYTSIVLLTAIDDSTSIRNAFSQGIDDYIVKPPNQIEMAARVYSAGRVASIQNKLLQATQTLQRMFETKCKINTLTGLGSKEDTYQRFEDLLKQSVSRGGIVCSAILKITEINTITGQYGQMVAEQIISDIANKLCNILRPLDLIGHISQHTFLLILHDCNDANDAYHTFRRIVNTISQRSYKTTAGVLKVHCNIAVHISKKDSHSIDVDHLIKHEYTQLN